VVLWVVRLVDRVVEATPVGDVVVVFGIFAEPGPERYDRVAITINMDRVAAQRISENPGADFRAQLS
jgi:hypothetical protein